VLRYLSILALASLASAQVYELSGRITPAGRGSVTLYGATNPFTASALTDDEGRFNFRKLDAATYTLSVFLPGRGEARQTIQIGPSVADSRGRIQISIALKDSDFDPAADRRRHVTTLKQLAIPERARREYEDAQHDLEKHDVESAEKRLEHAVELAPGFAGAWNNLGTIAYQTRRFPLAEQRFREALKQDPSAYEPLVNLGGVLVTQHKLDEALEVNVHCTLIRPTDALAESQLGMTYFELGQFDHAVKHLERARTLDPTHFSHPQLFLAEIHMRRGDKRAAADVLEEFIQHHPDYPQAAKVRESIVELRK
jgi:Tfp pilus assembly protein PilF